ncbi:hypothetical protein BC936DRAFT_142491 [Jimgerdemannia flammicorona]|uniref:Uncharacterized protein n=2 Tax=Jimgerdemannia flammicorona TaxID=994334 RepID=A0A433QHY6_9FUNG|nr:hypothetical protein BC936DRAFT_142491 [Jimgerdemannia flammicorona]RUS29426.1 hypothetical protein BC938DRAFT_480674 [Jimgerdemannia flammicorona]
MALITTNAPPLTKLVHVKHRALRKFCICINLRAGVIISCLVWAALGLYFAILAFQYQSPFYTYLNSTPLIVFGVLNLVMTFVGLFGVVAAALNQAIILRNLSHFVWFMMLVLLGDDFVNIIVFGNNHAEYRSTCMKAAQSSMNEMVQAVFPNGTTIALAFNTNNDFYNCDRMWVDELKFSVLAFLLMFVVYVYWAACIWSFSHKRAIIEANIQKAAAAAAAAAAATTNPPAPNAGQGIVQMPPANVIGMPTAIPGMVPGMAPGMNPGMMAMPQPGGGMGRGNIIVLNNEKSSKKKGGSTAAAALTAAAAAAAELPDNNQRDSGYSRDTRKPFFGFKIGHDGGVRELNQQDVDVELGLAAQVAADADRRYDTDSGVEDMASSGIVEYHDSRESTPYSKRNSRALTRKPVTPLQNEADGQLDYADYAHDYSRYSHHEHEVGARDAEEGGLR